MTKTKRDFLSIIDISEKEFWQILRLAKKLKTELKKTGKNKAWLKDKTLAMIFEKSSTRTRVSFEVGMTQLGGHAEFLSPTDIQIGRGELISDTGKVLSRYVDIIMYRAYDHRNIVDLAENSTVPVINALSDLEHPCQILADLMTVWEHKGKLKGLKIAYVGDCENNVTHSLALGCSLIGIDFMAAGPRGYHMAKDIMLKAKDLAKKTVIDQVVYPEEAVKGADVVVADTWVSMGDEKDKAKRLKIFKSYQVNEKLMALAKKKAIFMHCLPAYRGLEMTAGVIDGLQSAVWDEAENRLHAQKGLMIWLLKQADKVAKV